MLTVQLGDEEVTADVGTCLVAADPDVVLAGWRVLNVDHRVEPGAVIVAVPAAAGVVDDERGVAAGADEEAYEVGRVVVVKNEVGLRVT